ncbi:DUF6207 family protein [Streptomyces pseudogriseolus]|uniref:DUF6207 family protein n=1 Tax=Streptomyces pseudogriseolus TaxID=36817 RepID=UPI003FA1D16B
MTLPGREKSSRRSCVVPGMRPINDAHVAEPGLAVVEVAAADDQTAFAIEELLATRRQHSSNSIHLANLWNRRPVGGYGGEQVVGRHPLTHPADEGLEHLVEGRSVAEGQAAHAQQLGQRQTALALTQIDTVRIGQRLHQDIDQLGDHHEPLVQQITANASFRQALEGSLQRPPAPRRPGERTVIGLPLGGSSWDRTSSTPMRPARRTDAPQPA